MLTRVNDIIWSVVGLIVLSPMLLIISILIIIDSRGGVFYRQVRVGKNNVDFKIFKFRTMYTDADKKGLLTVGMRDSRITHIGYKLRSYKLDELPQLINVLLGDMSLVGPRPEVRKYVDLYNIEQLNVLKVKPGITDYASIQYANENEILSKSADPDKTYIDTVMPEKIRLNLNYINRKSLREDYFIIWLTIKKIISLD
ncbi:MAG: sugar transferase [Bacteroidetes bacterium]|nr:sugar transferase [Bacteroidota bacterium]